MNKVCIPSFSRSDYTSLAPVIKAAQLDKDVETQVLVGGSHLLNRFGNSRKDFEEAGLNVFREIPFLKEEDDSEVDFARAYQRLYSSMVDYFIEEKPDALFILGDRWEMLACSSAAFLLRIPIIHHSGGDLTQGSLDNQTRYTLSVQSHVHLVALEEHKERLIKFGEEDWRVEVVGEPALTVLDEEGSFYKSVSEIEGFSNLSEFALATFHPTTFEGYSFEEQIDKYIEILNLIDIPIVLTAPNPDPSSKVFYEKLISFAKENERIHLFENLGAKAYYTCMRDASFMIGNSSSGIWEAPSFKLPVINIGERQADRLRAGNVLDIAIDVNEAKKAIQEVTSNSFKERIEKVVNPYVFKDTNHRILQSFKQDLRSPQLLKKVLVDPLKD